jgi:hypothetical protein
MGITNVNLETGIRYGVISAHNVPELYDEITTNGTDETFEAYKADCVKELTAVLESHGQRDAEDAAKDIVSNYEWDDYQADEPDYSYDDGKGNRFLLSHLGGAPLIWVVKSTHTVMCRSLCSPCVPNAGDLDSGTFDVSQPEDGYMCYGIPDEWKPEEKEEEEEDGKRFDGLS